jgi:hypothetical protein
MHIFKSPQQHSKLYPIKATFNLPDPLYRVVKARSAPEGKTIREVVMHLFERWLENNVGETETQSKSRTPFETNSEGHLLIDGEPAPLVFGSL